MRINNKKKYIKLTCILMSMICTFQVQAINQDTRPYEYKDIDKKLNKIYKKILGKLSISDRTLLIKSQRAWILFRDLDCKWAFQDEPLSCMIRRTENRTEELKDTYTYDIMNRYEIKK